MNNLVLPDYSCFRYPLLNYSKLNNLHRVTESNRKAFIEKVANTSYNVENQNVLVGLLQQLAIQEEWSLEYVIAYTKLRSYSLASLFNITSINRMGDSLKNVFYYNDVNENLCLLENNKVYTEATLDINTLCPLFPLYTSFTEFGYKPSVERKEGSSNQQYDGVAIIAVDLVELAIGWWLYMKQPRLTDTGIHAYLVKYPMVNMQLLHNQLMTLNVVYERLVHGKSYNDLLKHEGVNFITIDETKHLEEYATFLVKRFTSVRMVNMGQMLAQMYSLYSNPRQLTLWQPEGDKNHLTQTRWIWEPRILKLYALYLTLGNQLFYRTNDINVLIGYHFKNLRNNYQRIPNRYLKEHLLSLLDEVTELHKENIK